jgi:hypothetical protein
VSPLTAVVCALSFSACTRVTHAAPPKPVRLPAPRISTTSWPRQAVLDLALRAYRCGQREGQFRRPVLTVIDYSLPASEPRLWVIDLRRKRVLHHELVAHGQNTGAAVAVAFSNRMGSRQSSLGLFRTDEPYVGKHGYSLRLSGLEPGYNDLARERAIVVHGAPYVSRAHIAEWGSIGRSWGCPALPQGITAQVIDRIADGTAVFAYYPDPDWLRGSRYLHCGGPYAER